MFLYSATPSCRTVRIFSRHESHILFSKHHKRMTPCLSKHTLLVSHICNSLRVCQYFLNVLLKWQYVKYCYLRIESFAHVPNRRPIQMRSSS